MHKPFSRLPRTSSGSHLIFSLHVSMRRVAGETDACQPRERAPQRRNVARASRSQRSNCSRDPRPVGVSHSPAFASGCCGRSDALTSPPDAAEHVCDAPLLLPSRPRGASARLPAVVMADEAA